ncbi:MAG: SRPBCC family protein [Candidatus Obscuribacterales bacterium]|nr:SRPBCC family protein [Candidatus Obscuribacterales bacterium]
MLQKVATWLVLGLSVSTSPALCQSNPGVRGTVKIDASPSHVWKAVHDERAKDPDLAYSKVMQQKGNRVLIEQKFNALPVIGEATCLMVQEETPEKRIDYKMVKSDKFKEMSGSWTLETQADGGVKLELCSLLDTGLPYSQGVINALLQDKINKRLLRIKAAAESLSQGRSNPL